MPHAGTRCAVRRVKALAAVAITDNFDRFANGTTLGGQTTLTGAKTWVTPGAYSSATIQGGQASTGVGGGANLVNTGAGGAQSVSVEFIVGSDVGNAVLRLAVRSDSALTNWIEFYYDVGSGLAQLWRRGTSQLSLAAAVFPDALAVGAVVRVSLAITAGGAVTGKINDVTAATGSDNTLSGTYVGFRSDGIGVGTTGNAFDLFASPAASPAFSDEFTRADAATLGAPWVGGASSKELAVASNAASHASGAAGFGPLSIYYDILDHGAGVQDIAVDHILPSTGNGTGHLIFGAAADMSSYYVLGFNGTNGSFNNYLSKFVGATETDYNTNIPITTYSGTAGVKGRWRLRYDPSTGAYVVRLNGVQVASGTIASPLTGTYVGIAIYSSNTATSVKLDNFASV